VVFIARVTAEGTVASVRVTAVPREGVGFEAAVTDAVMQWRFRPATNDGVAIPTTYVGKVNFTPQWSMLHGRMYTRSSAEVDPASV
jgi:TonB family protein